MTKKIEVECGEFNEPTIEQIHYLQNTKKYGDKLIVIIESNKSHSRHHTNNIQKLDENKRLEYIKNWG